MVANDNAIRRIAWDEVFPWLLLFRTIPIAGSLGVLVLALAGTVATPAGWLVSEYLFVGETQRADPLFAEQVRVNRSPWRALFEASEKEAHGIRLLGVRLSGPRAVFERLTQPFVDLFSRSQGGARFAYNLLGCMWTLAVWALVGCGITRICLLRLTQDESAGMDDALRFAAPRLVHCLLAIGLPLLAVFALVIPAWLVGLLMSFDAGLVLGSLLWFVVLLCGFLMTLLLLGMFFAWPLVIASISAESQSPLDAVTRCLSYVFQRPFHYAFYVVITFLLGGFCWLIVGQVAEGTKEMSAWAGSWGSNVAGSQRMAEIVGIGGVSVLPEGAEAASGGTAMFRFGRWVVGFWNGLISSIAAAFLYGLFWCMAAGIYLLLRQDVDEIAVDEVFVDEQSRSYTIPPLQTDAQGIPQIQPLDGPGPATE